MPRVPIHKVCFIILSVFAALISLFLHTWRIQSAPGGFAVDECSVAYNAYCIAETGADEYGVKYPVFFRCLDNYQDPVLIYCLAPLVKVFGLSKGIARFPAAIFHILAAIALGFLIHEYEGNKWVCLSGALVFSFIPWVFPMSRLVFSDTAMLLGVILGWWLLLVSLRGGACGYGAGAGFGWAFGMYARALGRPMVPLLLLCFLLAFHRSLLDSRKVVLVFLTSFIVALLPMIISCIRFPQSLTTRFGVVSVFQDHPSISEGVKRVMSHYLEYLSPRFLFLSGDQQLRHNTGFGGELFLFLIPMILAGLYCLVRSFKARPHYRFLALSVLIYPIVAALTIENMHSGRSITGAISWVLVAALGAQWLWEHRGLWRLSVILISMAGILEITLYMRDYFGPYQERDSYDSQSELTEALEYCFAHLGTNEVLYVSASTYCPYGSSIDKDLKPNLYVYPLFFGKIDPRTYQQAGLPANRVQFYEGHPSASGLILRCNNFYYSVKEGGGTRTIGEPDRTPIPLNAKPLVYIPFTGKYAPTGARYQIMAIPSSL